ncbi:MAG: ATP-dependent Clp protease ATP-binding subunit [Pyrinomonadaceae bacterium]|nr:ATP-dependent Clp protease ATP-binding subunit [Pyrinomonadaceae bacterium]MCX7639326.1 ATP-dependent Clp protease ATP-binding subunit [Pyrinomonadaceae bacterium]MDW8303452.1 ATP-dependent Clp protease ATP-binding subunit [Acidobacteriota bacterium]
MFEKYTEKARRVIFFARYEALQYGSRFIAPEHLLLGLLREDKTVITRFFPFPSSASIDVIRREIENRIVLRERIPQTTELRLAPETKRVLAYASEESQRLHAQSVNTEHILLGILREETSLAAEILREYGVRLQTTREIILRNNSFQNFLSESKKEGSILAEYTRDLTQEAVEGKLDPLIGREVELERLIEILCRRTKNNPVLIGEAGVGKTAIVEGLAQRIVEGKVPSFLEGKHILALDLSLVVAGTKYRGQFEERLKVIIKELKEDKRNIIFIDEIHTLVGAGSAEGSLDAANILKPALSRGEIQCIGATTPSEFRKTVGKDRALERRFQAVNVMPPSEEETLRIIEGLVERYEVFHQVRYSKEAIEAAVYLSNRYITERFLPDKAIDVLDEAGSRAKLRCQQMESDPEWKETVESWKRSSAGDDRAIAIEIQTLSDSFLNVEVTREDVEAVVARQTGIPVQAVRQDEAQKLLKIEEYLHKRIISQREAISALARAIRRSRAGLKTPNKPIGSFLFLGPTGVGKTEVARSLAEFLFGSEKALIRFDMSEYMERHSVARLIGSPPGYVGYEEGGQLTEKLRRQPYAVVLFDEIEKAHSDVFNLLLQVFDDGILTDSQGNTVDCKNAIFILTSNIGARIIQKDAQLGFRGKAKSSYKNLEQEVMSIVKQTLPPEFLNRLDEIIIFDELTEDDLMKIIDLQIGKLNEILSNRALEIQLTEDAKKWLIEKTCSDRKLGARPLKRALQKYVEDELSEALIRGDILEGSLVEIFVEKGKLNFRTEVRVDDIISIR